MYNNRYYNPNPDIIMNIIKKGIEENTKRPFIVYANNKFWEEVRKEILKDLNATT